MKLINPKLLLLKPEKFLEQKSQDMIDLAKYILLLSFIPAMAFSIASVYTMGIMSFGNKVLATLPTTIPIFDLLSLFNLNLYGGAILFAIVFLLTIIGSMLSFFIGGAIIHGFVRIFGQSKKYTDTLNVVALSMTPILIFGWIPFVNLWVTIQSAVVMVLGLMKKHKMSLFKSTMTIVIPLLILALLIPLLILYSGGQVPINLGLLIPLYMG